MILITHILVAITSVLYTMYTYLRPSQKRLRIASFLIGLTVATGTVLAVSMKVPLVRACMTGLAFIGFSLTGIIAASHKLAEVTSTIKTND